MFDFLRARGEEFLTQISNELMGNPRFIRAMQTAMRGKEWVDQGVAQALRTMNVPTRMEFKRAVARIDTLERELEEARRQADAVAAAARAARTAGAARGRAGKKKKTARRPGKTRTASSRTASPRTPPARRAR
jgi:hypothetical protein